jgi:hypothetical protein
MEKPKETSNDDDLDGMERMRSVSSLSSIKDDLGGRGLDMATAGSGKQSPIDGNGIILAPNCKADNDIICFNSRNMKICQHEVENFALDTFGKYVMFPSRFFHRGYYKIMSNMTYYTAQLFCTLVRSNRESMQNVTRKFNTTIEAGRIGDLSLKELRELTEDIRNNWESTYSVDKFSPAKEFGGEKIDAKKNRHIRRGMFEGKIAKLVKYFEIKYTHLEVNSVWLIEKSKADDGFQGWHRDFHLGTDVTTTIVVNIGAITMN